MTSKEFVEEFEKLNEKKLTTDQLAIYREKLRRFSSEELNAIYDKVLEEAKYFPKISEIYKTALGLGYLSTADLTTITTIHQWEPSNCRRCTGEGRLCVTWTLAYDDNRREVHTLSRIVPYSWTASLTLARDEFTSLFRCDCVAGDAPTIPKKWPRWSTTMKRARYA